MLSYFGTQTFSLTLIVYCKTHCMFYLCNFLIIKRCETQKTIKTSYFFLFFNVRETKTCKVPSIQSVMFSKEHVVIENSISTLYVSNCSLRISPTLFTTKNNMSFAISSASYSYLAIFSLLMMQEKLLRFSVKCILP